jgi:hypothetical protein
MKEVLKKLTLIQNELKVPKGHKNTFGKYMYRKAEDILEGLKPLLLKHNCTLYLSDDLNIIGDRYYVEAVAYFYCNDNESDRLHSTAYAREEEVKKGMDGAQITGTASSYARKYALNALFAIDDTADNDQLNDGPPEKKTLESVVKKEITKLDTQVPVKGTSLTTTPDAGAYEKYKDTEFSVLNNRPLSSTEWDAQELEVILDEYKVPMNKAYPCLSDAFEFRIKELQAVNKLEEYYL